MKQRFPILVSLFLFFHLATLADDQSHHHELSAAQLGAVSFPISCPADEQKEFEQGVAWLHSFEYEQSQKQFEAISQHDPKWAMAYWGQAMSLYHQLWNRPSKEDVARGSLLLHQAKRLQPATQRERDYIDAL